MPGAPVSTRGDEREPRVAARIDADIPALEKIHNAYAGKGLTILAIAMDEGSLDTVRAFCAERNITYTVLRGTDQVATKYAVRMIPATYLIDRQGTIQKSYLGEMNEERIEKDIQSLL